jgi:lipoprotein-anchoring transpeptidase ErfK/SrfK
VISVPRLKNWLLLILVSLSLASTMQLTNAQSPPRTPQSVQPSQPHLSNVDTGESTAISTSKAPSSKAAATGTNKGDTDKVGGNKVGATATSNAASSKVTATATDKADVSKAGASKVAPASINKKAASSASPFVNNHYVLSASMSMNGYHAEDPTLVIVDKGSHSTIVLQLQDDKIVRVLTISNAVGNSKKPTPPGRYSIVSKKKDPAWNPPKTIKHKPVAPYSQTHENPLGVAAIYLNKFDIDLHGTNDPKDIRKSISHGCVRHSNSDIMQLYKMVERGDTVYIIRRFRGTVLNKSDFKPRHHKKATA